MYTLCYKRVISLIDQSLNSVSKYRNLALLNIFINKFKYILKITFVDQKFKCD